MTNWPVSGMAGKGPCRLEWDTDIELPCLEIAPATEKRGHRICACNHRGVLDRVDIRREPRRPRGAEDEYPVVDSDPRRASS